MQARAEAYQPMDRFDTVIARAVGPLVDLVKHAGGLVAGGGRLLAMKGRYPTDELARGFSGWKVVAVHKLHVPGPGRGTAPRRTRLLPRKGPASRPLYEEGSWRGLLPPVSLAVP